MHSHTCKHDWKLIRWEKSISLVHGGCIVYPVYKCKKCSVLCRCLESRVRFFFYEYDQLALDWYQLESVSARSSVG